MRTKKDKPTVPPLAATLRAALASDWRTLTALDTLTAARGSDARRLVHEALRALRAEGCVLEERVGRGGVEVRLLTLPAPVPDDGSGAWEPAPVEVASAAPLQPAPALDAPAPPVGQAAPVEAVDGPVAPSRDGSRRVSVLAAHLAHYGHVEEAREIEGLPPAPKGPGPSSRCATCAQTFAYHEQHGPIVIGHRFQPKPRGRPRARLAAAQAADPDVEELPTASEQKAILDGAKRGYEAAVEEGRAVAEPETSRGGSDPQAPPAPVASSIADALRSRFPDAFAPEIIDGSDVATVAREMVDLTIAFSPVIARRDSIDAVGVTPLDNGRFRVDALWETTGLPMEVDAAGLAVMRARYLLLRGLLTRSLSAMDFDTRRAVVQRFFQGVEPWAPAPGSPLARMGAGPITITVPDGVGVEGIDWTALMGALAGEGGEVPAVVPVRPLGPPPPPAPPPEPPAAHVLEGPHDRACGYWKVHDPAHCDPAKLAAEIKICRACWGKMYALGGGRPRIEDGRKYVGCRYV